MIDDFFETEISSDNFLKPALSNLFESLDSQPLSSSLDAMRKRLFVFVQKKFNLYVEGGDESISAAAAGGGVSLHLCEGTKFNLLDEDMPVVVMPEDVRLSSEKTAAAAGGTSTAAAKRVLFASDGEAVKGKWNEIDAALGFALPSGGGGGDADSGDRMQVDECEVPPPVANQNINPNSGSGSDSVGDSVRSSLALQASMFSWRYPLLFDEMTRNNTAAETETETIAAAAAAGLQRGREDLTMTAMRVLETVPPTPSSTPESGSGSEQATHESMSGATAVKGTASAHRPDPLRAEAMRFVQDEISLW
jgi:hypothetical protein